MLELNLYFQCKTSKVLKIFRNCGCLVKLKSIIQVRSDMFIEGMENLKVKENVHRRFEVMEKNKTLDLSRTYFVFRRSFQTHIKG